MERSGVKAQLCHVPPSCVEPFLWVGLRTKSRKYRNAIFSLRDVGRVLEFCQHSVAERIEQGVCGMRPCTVFIRGPLVESWRCLYFLCIQTAI